MSRSGRPRLLVDLLSVTGHRGGTEVYAREIYTRLPRALAGWDLIAVANRTGADLVRASFPGDVHPLRLVGADRLTWAGGEALLVNRVARATRADLIWSPANFGPVTAGVPRVTTVHDVTYHTLSGSFVQRAAAGATARLMERTARTSTALLTGSVAARDAIVAHMGIDPERIAVVPHGTVDPIPVQDPRTLLERHGVPTERPILLSTGNRLPHKNFEGLLAALATIPQQRRPHTIITGGGHDDPLRSEVVRLGLQNDVTLPGWVTAEVLAALYAVADLYVCASLAEGFGLPVIDAMRRDCLVLANDIPVLREVGGDAALFADATDPAHFGTAILDALRTLPDDARRRSGRMWSERFTWESSAEGTARVLRAALDQSRVVSR